MSVANSRRIAVYRHMGQEASKPVQDFGRCVGWVKAHDLVVAIDLDSLPLCRQEIGGYGVSVGEGEFGNRA